MNILLTSVGRRAYMVKYFKEALAGSGEVHVCNSDDRTIAFHYADKAVVSPLIYSGEYIPFLLSYCRAYGIDVLISLFDMDLPVLAANANRFSAIGTRLIVSRKALLDVCNDKWKTYLYLRENGFNTPKTYLTLQRTIQAIDSGELTYPVIVKPRFGCGSIALSAAEDEMALMYHFRKNLRTISESYLRYESDAEEEKLVYQECLTGQEYGADIINDLSGGFRRVNIRRKIAMRAGETDIALLEDVPVIRHELERLGRMTGHVGNMDMDVFMVGGKPFILEMNARFGGGYPFSHVGGCDLPGAIVRWCRGEDVPQEMLTAACGRTIYKELIMTMVD